MGQASTSSQWGLLAFVACMPALAFASAPSQTVADTASGSHRGRAVPAIEDVLRIFATGRGQAWDAYDAVPGLDWRQSAPVENPDVADPLARYSRSGRLLLPGLGPALLPGGLDGDLRDGNEGESAITLSGDATRVHEIAVLKFYPSDDVEGLLRRQFAPAHSVQPWSHTAAPGTQHSYSIRMDGLPPVHVETFIDEEGGSSGPGSTMFVFYRIEPGDEPGATVAEMRCREG
jgi:hypothetical protein